MAYEIYTPRGADLQTRLLLRSAPQANGCIHFTGMRRKEGYGSICIKGKMILAHRAAYMCHVGPIPEGLLVCHHCDNPPCINPNHLFLGTDADNSDDKVAKNRQSRSSGHMGEARYGAKLTEADVVAIRNSTTNYKVVAAIYNIHPGSVYKIRSRKKWKHI